MRVAIVGFGAVGQGVARALAEKDLGIRVTGIADSKSAVIDEGGLDLEAVLERKQKTGLCGERGESPLSVIGEAPYDVLVEVTPTNADTGEPATGYIRTALNRGCHVVTSNKGPISLHLPLLQSIAGEQGVEIRYEATVCGAIPVIHAIREGLAGNEIRSIHGVMNGTCNYILSRMEEEGLTYEQALDEAREMGYAEADPRYDVEGIDTAIKLVILANAVWDMGITLKDVDITGITALTPEAIELASSRESTIRLVGEIRPQDEIIRVSPRILRRDHPLVVKGSLNAVLINCDLAGPITLIGSGAGSRETASAIIGDLVAIQRGYDRCH
ncbi:MAG: homoserine dehydrogenase [Methanoculleaceae archaeon]